MLDIERAAKSFVRTLTPGQRGVLHTLALALESADPDETKRDALAQQLTDLLRSHPRVVGTFVLAEAITNLPSSA